MCKHEALLNILDLSILDILYYYKNNKKKMVIYLLKLLAVYGSRPKVFMKNRHISIFPIFIIIIILLQYITIII